jgi:nitroimidazol reductase NimA-like FMN-containing flavoprotein (pyridoxamine 5'-phosphate oxidase superfamily)
MRIYEMTEDECRAALERVSFGALACARDNQPYVVPTYFAFDRTFIYAFATLGQKIEWMRSNPLVSLAIAEQTSHDQWTSVVVFGRYEELPYTSESDAEVVRRQHSELMRAHALLEKRAEWWEQAYVATEHRDQPHSFTPIFYRLHITQMTGRRATPDLVEATASGGQLPTAQKSWPKRILLG